MIEIPAVLQNEHRRPALEAIAAHERAGTLRVNGHPAEVVAIDPYPLLRSALGVHEFTWSESAVYARDCGGDFYAWCVVAKRAGTL